MSYMEKYKAEFTEKVRHYSQDEGLRDQEIADLLGCSRATVNRTRRAAGIPTVNLGNRLDKVSVCNRCGVSELIRRHEPRSYACAKCSKK